MSISRKNAKDKARRRRSNVRWEAKKLLAAAAAPPATTPEPAAETK